MNPPTLPLTPNVAPGCVHLTNYRGELVSARNRAGRPPAVIVRSGDGSKFPIPFLAVPQ